ncbi:hypothetical protein BEL04_00090 [Mucilaginibacter sp. PPCGB 2223]|uniref:hypothetical protein n=1 Tax=Mucilaginibacter sp. PPCGB 2223 TaxID=1886027 RepID=UPI00082407E2|nr:hypothetical protein [Mucilaginibacter sp. PPCGB 2223]OCX52774.1 hypothetical protein BEL04_00090 [Mucilaginibacter sp. PPCGB 2223]
MKLFRKRNKEKHQPANWLIQLRQSLEQRQLKLAGYLSRRTQYWSKLSWIVALALFIGLFGGCCLFLCIKAFIHFK